MKTIAEVLHLTHKIRLVRACCISGYSYHVFIDMGYIILLTIGIGALAIRRLKRKLID